MGIAIMAVSPRIHAVPVHAGRIPAFDALRDGRFVMKPQSILVNPSMSMLPIKIASMISPKKVHAIPRYLNAESMSLLRFTLFIFLLVFFLDQKTHIVQQECEHKQSNSGSKNSFVFH